MGHGFCLGKYKCRCRPGYEYPFLDENDFFVGDAMDAEWEIFISNNSRTSRFDQLKCRIAIANSIQSLNLIFLLLMISFSIFVNC